MLCKDDLPTASSIYTLIHSLYVDHLLPVSSSDTAIVSCLKALIIEGLKRRFLLDENDQLTAFNPLLLGMAVDPHLTSGDDEGIENELK